MPTTATRAARSRARGGALLVASPLRGGEVLGNLANLAWVVLPAAAWAVAAPRGGAAAGGLDAAAGAAGGVPLLLLWGLTTVPVGAADRACGPDWGAQLDQARAACTAGAAQAQVALATQGWGTATLPCDAVTG